MLGATITTLLIAGAVGAVVFTIATQLDERQMVRDSLRQLEGYEVENKRDQELLDPLRDRALRPLMDGLTGLGRRFTPVGYIDKVRAKFVHMGQNDPTAVDRFLALRAGTVVGAVLVFVFVFVINITPFSGKAQFAVGGLLMAVLLIGPDSVINRKVEDRQLGVDTVVGLDVGDDVAMIIEEPARTRSAREGGALRRLAVLHRDSR